MYKKNEIADQTIEIKIKEINKLITVWSGRNITPLGKITLIKSLLISKITHILLSLPTPQEKTIKLLEGTFNKFIWNSKPSKFRKEILENTNKLGGLKLTNITVFNNALKISWLKRLKNQDDGWELFPRHYKIHRMIIFGDRYLNLILQKIDNPFWKDVVKSCISLFNIVKKENNNAYNFPLWFNGDINMNYKKD